MIPGPTRPDLCVGGVVGTIYDVSFPGHSLVHCTSNLLSAQIVSTPPWLNDTHTYRVYHAHWVVVE